MLLSWLTEIYVNKLNVTDYEKEKEHLEDSNSL